MAEPVFVDNCSTGMCHGNCAVGVHLKTLEDRGLSKRWRFKTFGNLDFKTELEGRSLDWQYSLYYPADSTSYLIIRHFDGAGKSTGFLDLRSPLQQCMLSTAL